MDFQVIGGGIPKGFCGSGLIDLIASLRRSGIYLPSANLQSGFRGKPCYFRLQSCFKIERQ